MLQIPDPLDLPATPDDLRHQARHGVIDGPALRRAMAMIGQTPASAEWRRFADIVLLVLGAGLLVCGVIFFFAYNWDALHRFVKLGMIEGAIAIAAALAIWQGLDRLPGKVALTAAAGLVGALLAVYGQVYQTGADSYQLFALWAALITCWVLAGHFAPLWVGWLLLINLAIWLYGIQTHRDPDGRIFLSLFAVNALGLGAWEWAQRRGIDWLISRWTPRLCAGLALAALTAATVIVIFEGGSAARDDRWLIAAPPLFIASAGLMIYLYSQRLFDSFMLIAAALAACICINCWVVEAFEDLDEALLWILGAIIIGQTAGVVAWVRRSALRWEVREP